MTIFGTWGSRCWSRLGPAGVCGAVAIVAAAWLYGVDVQQRETELAELNARAPAAVAQTAVAELTPAQRAAAFQALFPKADTLPDWLERIEAASAAAGVVVERTDYRAASDAPAGIARYQIALPVKGTYAQVRAFVAALLEAVPTLAVT
ncbi:MAG: hypothetical protein ACM3SS_01015, partial [Rhodospirillaceae bacterium]